LGAWIELDAVLLYADLADSTEMALKSQPIAAEVYKTYLRGVTRIIRHHGGEVRSFDGDRVMGVFIGDSMDTQAATCGLQVNWFFRKVLSTRFKQFYTGVVDQWNFDQTVGIDHSSVHVARAGLRNDNDLIWVGRAPNIAARLSAIRHGNYSTLITEDVYKALAWTAKYSRNGFENMWTEFPWPAGVKLGVPKVYGSCWRWMAGD
jgi:adenylate cyclase